MSREQRQRHKAHLDQHIRDAGGEYHYIGDWYALQGGGKALIPFGVWSVLTAGYLIAVGCLRFPGLMNTWYVILPYLGTVCLLFALFWQGGKLLFSRGRVKAFVWENVKDNILPITRALAAFAVGTALLGGLYLLKQGLTVSAGDLAYFFLLLLTADAAWMAGSAFRKQKWELT